TDLICFGSACLVCWAVTAKQAGQIARAVAAVGAYSYSIYLWHFAVLEWFAIPFFRKFEISSSTIFIGSYVVATLLFGVLMSLAVEYPVLYLRDRLFPSRVGSITDGDAKLVSAGANSKRLSSSFPKEAAKSLSHPSVIDAPLSDCQRIA